MALGRRDTSSLVMLTGWDATELAKQALADGTTYATIVSQMRAALAALNREWASDWYTNMYSIQDKMELSYRVGSSNGFERFTEYGRADARRAKTEGHMLPLIKFDRVLGWTWSYLRDAWMEQISADIADGIKDARDRRRKSLLTRVLQRGDDSGAYNGLGATGYSPGFATDEGSTSVDYDPPNFEGTSFDNTHEHYVGITGSLYTNALFQDAYDELREHGHELPYEFLLGPSDRSTVEGLSKFTEVQQPLLRYGSTQDIATVSSEYFGTWDGKFRLREVRGMPRYWGFAYKTYGRLSQRNPLRVRVRKGEGTNWSIIAMPDPNESNGSFPLQNLMLFTEFGVGVGDRTNGTARYTVSATWADGTAT